MISPYRTTVRPLANSIRWRAATDLAGRSRAVLLPHELHPAWWEWPLRRRVARRLTQRLRRDVQRAAIIEIPYALGSR